ncbi:MAG: double-cubane-cluster-containing anaerobic reductase [Desulfoplanes sp.]|jgi:benzoyl-CoA reductase/2-hydroxyglutaryl-CoA dehydratase subunit BcrC/BadD/HgdB
MGKYDEMWEKLNIDMPAHEGLMAVLGKFYGDIYLSQQGRLQGMEYLDLVLSEIHGLRVRELQEAKQKEGRKVIGTFCVFVPEELTIAANAIQVGLCSGADAGKEEVEKLIPRNTCALIKSLVGFKLAHLCPFTESCDLIVGETTCDGKKKAYETLGEFAPVYVMEVPQCTSEDDKVLWKAEIIRYKEKIEEMTGNTITAESLKKAIVIVNNKRKAIQRLNKLRVAEPVPISGRDALLINQVGFYDDPERFTAQVNLLCDQLEEKIAKGEGVAPKGTPRLLMSGCPMAVPNWKLPYVTESAGAIIVGEESCVGTRNIRDLVDESGETVDDMINALTDRYLKIDCACFTPNTERVDNILDLAKATKADGVLQYTLMFCQPYAQENFRVEKSLRQEEIPSMIVETDYGMEDVEQLKTRIEAFVEMVK